MKTGLIGVNSVAALAIEISEIKSENKEIVLVDDNIVKHGTDFKNYSIKTSVNDIINKNILIDEFVVCFGEKLLQVKKDTFLKLLSLGLKATNFIHPSVILFPSNQIGSGNIISAGTIFGHESIIEDNTIVFSGAVIEHNTQIRSHCYIGPNATISGYCIIDEGTLIGSGATILPEIKIGKFCKIGAGAVVTKNVEDYTTVAGVPAQIINKN